MESRQYQRGVKVWVLAVFAGTRRGAKGRVWREPCPAPGWRSLHKQTKASAVAEGVPFREGETRGLYHSSVKPQP